MAFILSISLLFDESKAEDELVRSINKAAIALYKPEFYYFKTMPDNSISKYSVSTNVVLEKSPQHREVFEKISTTSIFQWEKDVEITAYVFRDDDGIETVETTLTNISQHLKKEPFFIKNTSLLNRTETVKAGDVALYIHNWRGNWDVRLGSDTLKNFDDIILGINLRTDDVIARIYFNQNGRVFAADCRFLFNDYLQKVSKCFDSIFNNTKF